MKKEDLQVGKIYYISYDNDEYLFHLKNIDSRISAEQCGSFGTRRNRKKNYKNLGFSDKWITPTDAVNLYKCREAEDHEIEQFMKCYTDTSYVFNKNYELW